MLPRLCSPQPPSWGWVMGSRVSAESHPHRSTRTRELQCSFITISFYLKQKASLGSLVGAFLWLSRGVASLWCQVCFRSSVVVNLHFSRPNSASVLSSCYSWYQFTWNCLHLEFSENHWFKAGVNVKAVFTSLTRPFCQYLGHVSSNAKSLCLFHCPLFGSFV